MVIAGSNNTSEFIALGCFTKFDSSIEPPETFWIAMFTYSVVVYVLNTELEEYVATETLEDVITQINTKFDSIDVQKKRWMFKITIPANTQSAKLNMNEDLTKYNVVLANSDGTHVFVYQETNSGFEIIFLTVILSSSNLVVEANKICKNA